MYFLLDTYPTWGFTAAFAHLGSTQVDSFRDEIQAANGSKFFPWLLESNFVSRFQQVRILICGRSGVGKSTLLNRIFGVDLVSTKPDTWPEIPSIQTDETSRPK